MLNDHVLLVGDGTKQVKEGRRMPGVKRHAQECEDSSKAEYIFGQMFGCIGAIITNGLSMFCIPLEMSIQDGLKETADWINGKAMDG